MKLTTKMVFCLVALFCSSSYLLAQGQPKIKGNRLLETQVRKIGSFTRLHVSMGVKAELTNEAPGTVQLEGETNILPYVITQIKDGELLITFPQGQPLYDILNVRVKLGAGQLDQVRVDIGASLVVKKTLASPLLTAELNSGGQLSSILRVGQLNLRMNGGSTADLQGESTQADINLIGGCKLTGTEFTTSKCKIDLSGGSNAYLSVNNELVATASGESELQYVGEPAVLSAHSNDLSEIEGIKRKAK